GTAEMRGVTAANVFFRTKRPSRAGEAPRLGAGGRPPRRSAPPRRRPPHYDGRRARSPGPAGAAALSSPRGGDRVDADDPNPHLSQIETHWSAVFLAHRGPRDAAAEAQRALMERYGGAVHRYLLASLRDPEAADDLAQEFALRFLRGDFRRA